MNNATHISQLLQMNIGQIRSLELAQQSISNIVDAQRESIKKIIEENKIEEDWANEFVEELK